MSIPSLMRSVVVVVSALSGLSACAGLHLSSTDQNIDAPANVTATAVSNRMPPPESVPEHAPSPVARRDKPQMTRMNADLAMNDLRPSASSAAEWFLLIG